MMWPILVLALLPLSTRSQFPTICNTQANLDAKTCCPNNCGGLERGRCTNVSAEVQTQWDNSNQTIVDILLNAPNVTEKGTADSRYLWPTVVFENVCQCICNYGGFDCTECDFGWTGDDCLTRKTPVIRKSFSTLTSQEKSNFVQATVDLKSEMGRWSVVVEEPDNYTSGTVTLQDVSTYNFFIFLHNFVARDGTCKEVDDGNIVDFAHSGPVFPVWHRRYMLTVEKEFQRIMNNDSFGFPYWQWEENDMTPFAPEYYGVPSNVFGPAVNVSGDFINPDNWTTICDLIYFNDNTSVGCSTFWKPCNAESDLMERRALQRGGGSIYLPSAVEVMIAIAAPSYDAADVNGLYLRDDPRTSFRSRLEGWNLICSAAQCVGGQATGDIAHMHNDVHDWVGGQMDVVPVAVNDPIFNLHHCNVDRVLESWMQRFTTSNLELLPAYVPVRDGHPGHNRDDFMVPFFPLVKAGIQYGVAEDWGYTYDSIVPANIPDAMIPDCSAIGANEASCPICDANATCINCTASQTCPPFNLTTGTEPTAATDSLQGEESSNDSLALGLGLGLGLGIPLLVAIAAIVVLVVVVAVAKSQNSYDITRGKDTELAVRVNSALVEQ